MNASVVSRPTAAHLAYLAQCRAIALEMMPYLSSILLRLDVWNAPGLGTYAVDRRWRLYIDFDHCIANESVQLGAESLLHECGHILGEHARISDELGIDNDRRRRLWNLGSDCAINDDLAAAGCDELAKIGVLPAKIGAEDFKTPQHYYFILKKKQAAGLAGSRARVPRRTARAGSQASRTARAGISHRAALIRASSRTVAAVPALVVSEAPCEFVDGDDAGHPVSTIEAQAILVQTAQDIIKSRGTAPSSMVEEAETLLKPSPTPWQRLLAAHVRQAVAWAAGHVDQSYQRRSRRRDNAILRPLGGGDGRKLVKPGWVAPTPSIEAIVDTSGSMSVADVAVCRNEIEAIARKVGCRGDSLVVTEVDAKVQSSQKYRTQKALGGIHGRGGTDMRVGIQHALNRKHRPDIIVLLTDGETPYPEAKLPVPLIVVIVGEPSGLFPIPPWAKTVVVPTGQEHQRAA